MNDTIAIAPSLINAIICLCILFNQIRHGHYRVKKDLAFLGVIFTLVNGAIWTMAVIYIGINDLMLNWRTGYSVLLSISLIILLTSDD